MTPSAPETCWPSPEQELLLKAALLKGEGALRAWSEWQARANPDDLDQGSRRLLPLLWHNLSGLEEVKDDASLMEARAAYRRTRTENNLLLHQAASFLKDLRAAGHPAMLLKGLALIVRYYGDCGLRPMGDFDVLIPAERTEDVIGLLQIAGWKPIPRAQEAFTRPYREVVHGHAFRRSDGWCVDLHWHVMEECVWPGADDDFWSAAEEVDLKGIPALLLNPADQMLHVCVHGTKWENIPTLRWVADAAAVMAVSGSTLDWDRLVAQASKRKLTLPVRAALGYLRVLLDIPVPGEVLERLESLPVPRRERKEFQRRTRRHSSMPLSFLPTLWYKHSRMEENGSLLRKAWGFIPFIRKYWGMENWREFLSFVAKAVPRGARRVRRR